MDTSKKPKFIEAADLPEGEKVYLAKGWGGWRVVQPIPKDITKPWGLFKKEHRANTNWDIAIYGGKAGLIRTLTYIIIALMVYYGVNQLIASYRDVAANPCAYCSLSSSYNATAYNNLRLTSGLNLSNYSISLKGDVGEAGS